MRIVKLDSGSLCDLYAVEINGDCPVQGYISSLQTDDRNRVLALLDRILKKGPPRNKQKFRALGDGIWELKLPRATIRILCFFGDVEPGKIGKSLILTHGIKKPKEKVLKREKQKALEWLKQFLETSDITN
jgi:phage-related protein